MIIKKLAKSLGKTLETSAFNHFICLKVGLPDQHKQSQENSGRGSCERGRDATAEVRAFLLTLMIDFSPPVKCD